MIRRSSHWLWVTLAGGLYLVQMLSLLHTRWVEDESWQSIPAYSLITEGRIRNPTFAETDGEYAVCVKPPGHTLVLAPSFKFFGINVIAARLPSVLAGLATVILTFLLGRALASSTVGIVAALLVATDNFLFLGGRTARPDVFVTALSLFGLLLFWWSQRKKSARLALASGIAIGLSMLFHPNGLPAAVAVGVMLIIEFRARVFQQLRTWAFTGGLLAMVLPFWIWAHATPARQEAFVDTYSRGERVSFATKLNTEAHRYVDFLGVSSQRFKLPFPIPYRAHIAAIILASLVVLWSKDRKLLGWLLLAIAIHLIWWLYLTNKTARYFVVLSPYFAIAVAGAAVMIVHRRAAIAVCLFLGVTQLAGNALVLAQSRNANYPLVTRQLRALIPPGASVYGAITFWVALHDHPYYCYERMPFEYAIAKRRPDYFILNDRVMIKGMGWGEDDWAALRQQANTYAREHCELAGHVLNSFYGDLEIYRLKSP